MQCPRCGNSSAYPHGASKGRGRRLYFCSACQQVFAGRIPRQKPLRLWLYRLGWLGLCLVVLLLAIAFPLRTPLLAWGLNAFVPPDSGASVDAIVVLGRGPDLRGSRIGVVAELWQSRRSPKVFTSGMSDSKEMIESLEELGVPREAMQGETCSQTTEENALFTATLLYPQKVRKILLVTDKPHILRSLLVFQSVGFEVIPHASALPTPLDSKARNDLILREYGGLLSYQFSGKFKARSLDEFAYPPTEVSRKIVAWKCKK